MVSKKIVMDVWKVNDAVISINFGEVNSRFLYVSFREGENFINLEGFSVVFYAQKPDGNVIFNNCPILQNTYEAQLELTSQMSNVLGVLDCEFYILSPPGQTPPLLKITGLKIVVGNVIDSEGAIESTSEYSALTQALAQVQEILSTSPVAWVPTISTQTSSSSIIDESGGGLCYKLGKLCVFNLQYHCYVQVAGTGAVKITGIPFAPSTSCDFSGLTYGSALTSSGGIAHVESNSAVIFLKNANGIQDVTFIGSGGVSISYCGNFLTV
ncbi:MAG: hypothetical protein LBP36_00335 [Oscillospiraceae bacterium]|jgi:hypothetical protein|nr:hypothetical protein [Oscillospiraceae bacterium]